MNFLNTSLSQVSDLFKSMSAGARITAGLLLVLVVVSLGYLMQFPSNTPNDYLLGGRVFSSGELAAMEAAFSKSALNNYSIDGNRVRVPRSQRTSYVLAMAENQALPQNFGDAIGNIQGSPWESEQARRERVERAVQQELGLVIREMPGIERATVQIDERTTRGFPTRVEVTAMVGVASLGSGRIDPQTIETIRELVAAAKAGLSTANITVTDLTSGTTYPGGGTDGTTSARHNPYYLSKLQYQSEREEKAREILSYIPGIQVVASAELDPTLRTSIESLVYDSKGVTFNSTTDTRSETTTVASDGGRVGTAANNGAAIAATESSSAGGSEVEESREHTELGLSPTHTMIERPGLIPKRVTFSVSVPSTYYRQVYREQWLDQNELPEGEDIPAPTDADMARIRTETDTKIKDLLVQLMPGDDVTEDKHPLVTVTSFQSLSVEQPDPPGMMDKATTWLGTNWSMLGMLLIGGAGLVMLRGLVRNVPSTGMAPMPTSPALHLVSEPEEGQSFEEEDTPNRVKRRFSANGPNVKEDLADMVREDPDTAANILKSWIGDSA